MRAAGTFIAVEFDPAAAADTALAAKLSEVCPVDIFAQNTRGFLEIVERNLDECVLCRLCLDAAGAATGGGGQSAVRIIKLYDEGAILA